MTEVCPTCLQRWPIRHILLHYGALSICPTTRQATIAGHVIKLSRLECRIMLMLMMSHGRACSVDMFLDAMYYDEPDREPFFKVVGVYIGRLRTKLSRYGIEIQNNWGRGWILIVPEKAAA